MNLKTMFGIGLVSFGVAFAQEASESATTAPSYSEQQLQQQEEQAAASESLTSPVPFVLRPIANSSSSSRKNRLLLLKASRLRFRL